MPAPKARAWYQFRNQATDPSVAEIHIIDVIGGWEDDWIARNWGYEVGVTARQFVEDLAKLSEGITTINLRINSPGGDVQGGINIANALREQQLSKGRSVNTYVDGLAASIASVIAMAGSKVVMADNALMMIHNPWSIEIGSAADLRKTADVLDTIRGQIVNTYKWHSSLDDTAIVALMDAETWMSADEAIANGFATDKVQGLKAAACVTPQVLAKFNIPDKYRARVNAFLRASNAAGDTPAEMIADSISELQLIAPLLEGGTVDQLRQALGILCEVGEELGGAAAGVLQAIEAVDDNPGATASLRQRIAARAQKSQPGPAATASAVLAACRQGNCLELAEELINAGATFEQVNARVQSAKTAKDAETSRRTLITAACKEANQPELAAGYIAGAMPLEQVRAQLAIVRGKQDRIEIDAGLNPDQNRLGIAASWKKVIARVQRGGLKNAGARP